MQVDSSEKVELYIAPLLSIREQFSATNVKKRWAATDHIYRFVLLAASSLVFVLILAIIWEIYAKSRLSIHTFGLKFLTSTDWDPVQQLYSLRAFAMGTLYTSFWALLIAVPISLGTAIFATEIAPPWIYKPLTFLIELLAAIPSVVYGIWGIFVMVPWLVDHVETPISNSPRWGTFFLFDAAPNGNDFFAASLLLSIMVIPIISGVARDILRAVPRSVREASYALGATKWETIRRVVLPHARTGILGAVILGLGRALGETMAVTMVIGNNPDFHWALFSPGYTMSSVIANEFSEAPLELYRSALMEIAFALLIIAIIVNGSARLLVRMTAKSMRRS